MEPVVAPEQRDPRIQTRMLQVNGVELEVDECGVGEHLALCLHGFPEHSFSWRFQLPMLADLGYRAWAPNLRGYGGSSKPQDLAHYSIETLMADVAGLIDASGARQTTLLAHDWGAVIAWYFAIRQIRPLQHLVICNVPHPQAAADAMGWAQLKRSWYVLFFQIPGLAEKLLSRDNGRALATIMRDSAVDVSRFDAGVGEVYRRNAMQPGALTAMVNYYRALIRGGGAKRQRQLGFPNIDTPTLMIWGEDDVALTKETTLTTSRYVNNLTLRYLPRVSHWVQQEQPEVVNAMIQAFLRDEPVPELLWTPELVLPSGSESPAQ